MPRIHGILPSRILRAGTVAFTDSPSMLWIILGIFAVGGPLVALLMKKWFTKGAHFERSGAKA